MTNNLLNLKKNLKSFAKRCKDFKYTDSALLAFLLSGMLISTGQVFAETVTNSQINNQVSQINTSINQMRTDFKRARAENNKLIKDTNLELTQLMEQGDHVTKSPWSSWQFGANGFYSDWHGTYKGKGNKISNIIYKRDQTLNKYIAKPVSEKNANNTTLLGFAYEPNAEIPISASIIPKSISKVNPNIKKNVTIAGLPSFEPRVVVEPVAPSVTAPNPRISISLNINSSSKGSGEARRAFATSGDAVFESVAVTSGKFVVTTSNSGYQSATSKYTASNVNVKQIYTNDNILFNPLSGHGYGNNQAVNSLTSSIKNNAFFQVNGDGSFGITLNAADIDYKSERVQNGYMGELVHQDVHPGGSNSSNVDTALGIAGITGVNATVFSDIYKTNVAKTSGAKVNNYNVFANAGNINISGDKAIFTHSYNHGGNNGIVMNAGNVTLNTEPSDTTEHAVFLVSASSNNNNVAKAQQHFYNTGTVTTNTPNTAMFLFVPLGVWGADDSTAATNGKRPISVTNKNKLVINGDNSVGIFANNNSYGVTLHLNFSTATSAGSQTQITDHSQSSNNNNSYVNTLTGGIVDKKSARGTGGVAQAARPMTINSNKSAGLYMPQKNSFINGQFAVELTNNANLATDGSAGIYSNSDVDLQGHYVKVGGKNNVGVYPVGDGGTTVIYLGKGTVEVNGGSGNSGIVVKDNNGNGIGRGRVYSKSEMVMEGGKNNTAIYVGGHSGVNENDVTIKSLETDTTPQEDTVYIYSEKKGKVKTDDAAGGLSIKGKISSGDPEFDSVTGKVSKTVGAVYATGGETEVNIEQASSNTFGRTAATDYNIDITGAQVKDKATSKMLDMYSGFGLFAENGAEIKADYNKVKAVDTGAAIASIGNSSGTGSSVVLDHGEVYYKGSGFALFAKDDGKISLQNGKLTLDGKATGFSVDYSLTTVNQPIKLNGTTVNIDSDDVILMSVKNANNLNTTGMGNALLSKVGLTTSSITGTATRYKYAVLDGATINVDGNIDKSDTTAGSDSEVFTRRIQLQNSIINVLSGNTVKAHLNSTELTSINPNLSVPVGLDVSASGNSTSRATTGVNVANGATISVDRTDSGNGGVGAYVNYGKVHNEGKIEVEKTTPNDHAVGIYATNGTEVNNDTTGTVEVGGKNSIGILGLSYRIDSKGNVVYEKFGTTGPSVFSNKLGTVDITNSGKITLDGDNSLGIYAKNNSLDAAGTNADYLRDSITYTNAANDGEITMTGKNAIGMIIEGGIATNDTKGKITISGQEGVAMYGTAITGAGMAGHTSGKIHSELNNKGTIDLADTTTSTPIIGMFTNDADTDILTSGTINVGKKSYGIYGVSNKVEIDKWDNKRWR